MTNGPDRKEFLQQTAAAVGATALGLWRPAPGLTAAPRAPTSAMSIARCGDYEPAALITRLSSRIDRLSSSGCL